MGSEASWEAGAPGPLAAATQAKDRRFSWHSGKPEPARPPLGRRAPLPSAFLTPPQGSAARVWGLGERLTCDSKIAPIPAAPRKPFHA